MKDHLSNISYEILKESLSYSIIKEPIYSASDVLSNLAVIDTVIALNAVFDFNDAYLVIGNKNRRIIQDVLQDETGISLENIIVCGKSHEALGIGVGLALESHKKVVIMIDDYVLNYGKTFEALTQIQRHQPNIVVVYVEDEHSFLQSHKSKDSLVNSLRTSKTYVNLKKDVKHLLDRPTGKPILSSLSWVKEGLKDIVTNTTVFDQFGLEYYGVVDAMKYKDNLHTFESVVRIETPTIVHVKTNLSKLRGLKLPRYKTDDDLPENYYNYIDAMDMVLANFDSITLCVDITSDAQHMPQFAIKYPDNYYVSTGTYQYLVDFIKGLTLLNKRVVFMIDSENFNHIASLIEEQFYANSNLCIILRDSGLSNSEDNPGHGVFDVGLALRFSSNIYMGKDIGEALRILKYVLDQDDFPLSVIRIPCAVGVIEEDDFNETWEILNPNTKPMSVVFSYGESVKRLNKRVVSNNLPVWIINTRNIFKIDLELMNTIKALDIPIVVYDLEDVHHSLFRLISMYLPSNKIINMGLQHAYLKYGGRTIRRKYKLNVDDVLEILPK